MHLLQHNLNWKPHSCHLDHAHALECDMSHLCEKWVLLHAQLTSLVATSAPVTAVDEGSIYCDAQMSTHVDGGPSYCDAQTSTQWEDAPISSMTPAQEVSTVQCNMEMDPDCPTS